MRKPFSSIGVFLLSLLLFASASAGFLGFGNAEVPVIQQPVTDKAGDWHAANLTAKNTIVLMFMPASKKYAIYWRLTPSGEIEKTAYGTIGKGSTQSDVPNSRYVKQFQAERQFWVGQTP